MHSPVKELEPQKLFGTDGIRGEAGKFPLDAETVGCVGASLARILSDELGRKPRIVTGRDTRESGGWIEQAFHDGAVGEGAVCDSSGVLTTPGVAFVTGYDKYDAGVVISASHNPFHDNGIKIFTPDGRKLSEQLERKIEADVQSHLQTRETDVSGDKPAPFLEKQTLEFHREYLDHLSALFPDLRLDGIHAAVDAANGAASYLAPQLFSQLGANLTVIHAAPDGRNINADCGSLHLEHLQRTVAENRCDIGIAFDGDADRSLFTDEQGNVIDGDATLWILACYMQDHGGLENGKVVATVMSNMGLEVALRSRGLELIRTSVGDKYVLEALLETGSDLGGEQSGHIIFPKASLVGDGMLTALSILRVMKEKGKKLSELAAGFERFPQILINVPVKHKRSFNEIEVIAAAASQVETDLAGNGRLLLRYSGTENLARVMIEGRDQAEINEQAERLAAIIRNELG